jgi:hypothetical protein
MLMGIPSKCNLLSTLVASSHSLICLYTWKCRTFCYLMNASNAASHNFTFHLLQSVPYFAVSRTLQMSYTSQEFLWATEILLSKRLDKHSLIMGFEHRLWWTWDRGPNRVSYRGKKSPLVQKNHKSLVYKYFITSARIRMPKYWIHAKNKIFVPPLFMTFLDVIEIPEHNEAKKGVYVCMYVSLCVCVCLCLSVGHHDYSIFLLYYRSRNGAKFFVILMW